MPVSEIHVKRIRVNQIPIQKEAAQLLLIFEPFTNHFCKSFCDWLKAEQFLGITTF